MTPGPTPAPRDPGHVGGPVRVVMTKWRRRPHWEYDAVLLGRDRHGTWLGVRAGTPMARPGATYVAPTDQVVLVPDGGAESLAGGAWVATFHAAGGPLRVYVDIATPPVWSDAGSGTVTAVDLDLDVVCGTTGRVWVDDEDEFADHRVRFGYPAAVVATALESCAAVEAAVAAGAAPYDGTAEGWLRRLAALPATRHPPAPGAVPR